MLTLMGAERGAPVLMATEKEMLPFPVPEGEPAMLSHGAPLDATHTQPVVALTLIVPEPPVDGNVAGVAVADSEHVAGSCASVNVCPAIVRVALRPPAAPDGFACAV
jgi:hypothetical protein